MRSEFKRKILLWVVFIGGTCAFLLQLVQFFTGRWSYDEYFEVFMLILFLYIAIYPKRLVNIFESNILTSKFNKMIKKDDDFVDNEEAKKPGNKDTGGSIPEEDEEV